MGNKSSERDCFDLFRNDNPKSTLGISVKKLLVGDIIESEKPDFVIGDVGIEHFLVDQLFTKKKSQAMSIERKNKSLIKSKVDNYCKHPQELDEDIDNGAAAKFVEDIVNSQVNATSTFSFNDFVDNFKRIFNNHYNNRFEYRERCSKLGFLIEIPYGESHYIISQKNKYRYRPMSNGKKSKTKSKTKQCPTSDHVSAAPVQISADELQHLIAKAIVEAEDIRVKREAAGKAEELNEWHKAIGYDKNKTGLRGVCNKISSVARAMFVNKHFIKGDRASVAIIQNLTSACFHVLKFVLELVALALFIYPIVTLILPRIGNISWWKFILLDVYALFLFTLSRVFKMAGVETSKMENRNDLYTIFAALSSFISMIVAIIAVVKGG